MDLFANGENAERRKIVRYISLVAEALNRDADAAQREGRGLDEARLRREACLLWSMATDVDQGEHHGARLNKLNDERSREWRKRRESNPYSEVGYIIPRPDFILTPEDLDPAAPPAEPAATPPPSEVPEAVPPEPPLPSEVIRAAAVEEDDRVPHPALVALAQMAHAPPAQPPPAPKLTGLFGSREKAGRPPRHEAAQPPDDGPDDPPVPQSCRSIPAAEVAPPAPLERQTVAKPKTSGNETAGLENLKPPRSREERREEERAKTRAGIAARMKAPPSKPSNGEARPLARRPADWQGAPVLLQDGDEDA